MYRRRRFNKMVFLKRTLLVITLIIVGVFLYYQFSRVKMPNFVGKREAEFIAFAEKVNLDYEITYIYTTNVPKGKIISQTIEPNTILNDFKGKEQIVISKGSLDPEEMARYKVNELGYVPIMMYHGIRATREQVDYAGYNRYYEDFKKDLEFFYEEGYRMITLGDFISGNISTPLGYSPIVLTFDDGNRDNFNILGFDEDGNIIIDSKCAVGILEEFKKKYPDYNVTATFFLNKGLFNGGTHEELKIKWLVENGYEVANHTYNHTPLDKVSYEKVEEEIGKIEQLLESIVPGRHLQVLAKPNGRLTDPNHANFPALKSGSYNGVPYKMQAALNIGKWFSRSIYDEKIDIYNIPRIRATNEANDEINWGAPPEIIDNAFASYKDSRYVSDGNQDTIVFPEYSPHTLNKEKFKDKYILRYE